MTSHHCFDKSYMARSNPPKPEPTLRNFWLPFFALSIKVQREREAPETPCDVREK